MLLYMQILNQIYRISITKELFCSSKPNNYMPRKMGLFFHTSELKINFWVGIFFFASILIKTKLEWQAGNGIIIEFWHDKLVCENWINVSKTWLIYKFLPYLILNKIHVLTHLCIAVMFIVLKINTLKKSNNLI